jgi:uncharacterized RmlC-like cupin family protein
VLYGDRFRSGQCEPHQERNLSAEDLLEFVVVRSDNERIAIKLDTLPVEQPEIVF